MTNINYLNFLLNLLIDNYYDIPIKIDTTPQRNRIDNIGTEKDTYDLIFINSCPSNTHGDLSLFISGLKKGGILYINNTDLNFIDRFNIEIPKTKSIEDEFTITYGSAGIKDKYIKVDLSIDKARRADIENYIMFNQKIIDTLKAVGLYIDEDAKVLPSFINYTVNWMIQNNKMVYPILFPDILDDTISNDGHISSTTFRLLIRNKLWLRLHDFIIKREYKLEQSMFYKDISQDIKFIIGKYVRLFDEVGAIRFFSLNKEYFEKFYLKI